MVTSTILHLLVASTTGFIFLFIFLFIFDSIFNLIFGVFLLRDYVCCRLLRCSCGLCWFLCVLVGWYASNSSFSLSVPSLSVLLLS